MMRLSLLLALTLTLGAAPALAASPAPAASPKPAGATLTLQQALDTARANQPLLRQAQADIASSVAASAQSRAGMLPQLSASTSYQFGPSRQNVNQVGVPVTNLGNYSVGLSADQLLYDFGQADSRYRASVHQVEAQTQSARQTTLGVVLNVRTAFLTARANQLLVAVAEESLANELVHQRQTKNLVEIGTRPPIDMAQTASDVATARLQLINAQNAYQTAKAQLNQAMGVESGTDYRLEGEAIPPVKGEDQALDALLTEAVANRPDLQAMSARLKAQTLLVEAAEHANYPSLRASAGAGSNGTPVTAPNQNWNAGVGLSWPLYTGGAREAQADAARSSLQSLQAQSDSLRQQLRLALEQARLAVVSAKGAGVAAKEGTRAARVRLDLAEGRYSAGVGSVIELGDAQVAFTSARAREVQEQYKLETARAQLLQALGRE